MIRPTRRPTRRTRAEDGITTAEYAVGTAAGAGLAGLLYQLLTGGFGDQSEFPFAGSLASGAAPGPFPPPAV